MAGFQNFILRPTWITTVISRADRYTSGRVQDSPLYKYVFCCFQFRQLRVTETVAVLSVMHLLNQSICNAGWRTDETTYVLGTLHNKPSQPLGILVHKVFLQPEDMLVG